MRYYDAVFPVMLSGHAGTATVRVVHRRYADYLLPGWSFCLVGPLAIGLHLADHGKRPILNLRASRFQGRG